MLEVRNLLSVTPADLSAVIVNETYGGTNTTTTAHSVASDNASDFVVTWAREDPLLNSSGNPIMNPVTGEPYQVSNVYARYFTDTVERVILPGPGTKNNAGQTLPNGIATNFDNNPNTVGTFSLAYNDETIDQISVTGGNAPAGANGGTIVGPVVTTTLNENVAGQFTLWFDANGNGIIDSGEILTVNYNEFTPQLAAAQIQTWLRGIAPVAGNPGTGFGGSDATHATVNAIDPHTFVVDFGAATDGLDQSKLLQYLSPSASTLVSDPQQVTFTPTGLPPVNGTFQLQVGTVVTSPIIFNSSTPAALTATAHNMQAAGQWWPPDFPATRPGLMRARVRADMPVRPSPSGQPEPAVVQYVAAALSHDMPITFANNSAGTFNLSGFLPAVQLTNLDHPFTVNNIPVSQTDPNLTAYAIQNYFEQGATTYSSGQAPFNFPPPNRINPTTVEAPYYGSGSQ